MIDITEVSKRTGQSPSSLRYYEEHGLIKSTGRNGLKRTYDQSALDQLALIALGKAAGFSLEEIKEIFQTSSDLEINRKKLKEKARELDRLINRLIVIRDGLNNTAECSAPSHMECPNFLKILTTAGRGKLPPLDYRGIRNR